MAKWTLALGGSDHDASAALVRDGEIRVVIEQERLSRRKHGVSLWYESPVRRAVDYCLQAEGIRLDDVSVVVASDTLPARVKHEFRGRSLRLFGHHLCHAASAYLMLPPGMRAGVIVYDGFGSVAGEMAGEPLRRRRETFSSFVFGPQGYECVVNTCGLGFHETEEYPIAVTDSIGMLYEMVTASLGYDLMDSGKTMGLSSYGQPCYLESLERFVKLGSDPARCFVCATDDPELERTIQAILLAGHGGFQVRADLAASLQNLTNRAVLNCEQFFAGHPLDAICIAGGCALNTVANSFFVENSTRRLPISIPPHCGDAGLGLGALWLNELQQQGTSPAFTFRGKPLNPWLSRPGRSYSPEERNAAVNEVYPRLVHDPSIQSPKDLARFIAEGRIVGIFNRGSEIGPRALGGRSLLADPRSVLMRERINRIVKGREPYRPLAPIVLLSRYDHYFEDQRCADPFMLKVARARETCRRDAPAVVHVDGTARVQTLQEGDDPLLVDLLRAFEAETRVGLLINTSFNRRGEPIVETPGDAIDTFLGMKLDGLYLDGDFYRPADANNPVT